MVDRIKKILQGFCFFALAAAIFIGMFTGCADTEEKPADGGFISDNRKNERYAEKYQMVSLSEAGIIYSEDGLVHLVTVDEGEDMVLCYDPNCRHVIATKEHTDVSCMAALYYGNTKVTYYEGCVYFFVPDGIFAHKIYRMDTDGAGRELVAELPFQYNISQCALFSDDFVYYIAKIPHVNDTLTTVWFTIRIVEVNIKNGSYRFITEETEDNILQINLSGKSLYIRKASSEDGGVYTTVLNTDTLEEKVFITGEINRNEYSYIDAYDEDSFFYYGKNTYDIGIRNIDGTLERVLLKGAENEGYGWADPSCDGLFYNRTYAYGEEAVGSYFMDFTTGEIIDITDEKERYNIVGYDGYYGVFVSRDEEFNWKSWSKEKVLDEAKSGT